MVDGFTGLGVSAEERDEGLGESALLGGVPQPFPKGLDRGVSLPLFPEGGSSELMA